MGLLITDLVVFLIMTFLIVSEIGIKIPKFTHTREYLTFGLPTVPGNLSSWVVNSSDRYVIGIFLGAAFVGYYSPGYALGSMILMFLAPLSFMLPAVLSKYYDENNMNEVKTVLKYSLKYFLLLAIPATFGLSLLSKPILTILSTPAIAAQGYLITPFIALSAVLFGIRAVMTQIFSIVKRTKIGGGIWMIAAILNLILNIICIPYIGILGAAISTLTAYAFSCFLGIYYAFKYLKFDIDLGFISKSIFSSTIMSLVIINWYPAGLLNVLILIGICAFLYAAVLLLLKGVKKEEITFFRQLFRL
jgi:O-antigen/teichoic acid export membrane protein